MFVCAGCGAELTGPLSEVALPAHSRQEAWNGRWMPALMEPGTYAVQPEPSGPPYLEWDEFAPGEPEARGVYAWDPVLSDGPAGAVLIAPGELWGTYVFPDAHHGGCCGVAGGAGPNTACSRCRTPVATRIDDCYRWQEVWLHPPGVRRIPGPELPADRIAGWAELVREIEPEPPVDPYGSWSPVWHAAVSVALAHLLVGSGGRRVVFPKGPVEQVFRRSAERWLPDPARGEVPLRVAGPGLPGPGPGADALLLVPSHPRTGRVWEPADDPGARRVPLPFPLWLHLARGGRDRRGLPATGRLPAGVARDDPAPPAAAYLFEANTWLTRRTLARLPAVREPWPAALYARMVAPERRTAATRR
ncbi:hypothetical protein [Streptomyces sp. NPDC097619]|uniref:hypothetical protein n=1 Tax=Streptomyces sp. NPDC097619 TaxID=3157228 RepID=UPI0033316811